MNRRTDLLYRELYLLILLVVFVEIKAWCSCGLAWGEYQIFENVSNAGYVNYTEGIGNIKLASGGYVPLSINFRSNRSSSHLLGPGWLLPFLESYIVQVSEDEYQLYSPDGREIKFTRTGSNPKLLQCAEGWLGEVNESENTITISSACGLELKYKDGKLRKLTASNQVFDYVHNKQGLQSITCDGQKFISVNTESIADGRLEIDTLEKKYKLNLARVPVIETINGKNVISGYELSLASISSDSETYEYKSEVDDSLRPKLVIPHANLTFVWNANTKQIESDSKWRYNSTSSLDGAITALERIDQSGLKESIKRNESTGIEEYSKGDYSRKITRFTSAKLNGLTRSIEEFRSGQSISSMRIYYNELGKPVKEIRTLAGSEPKIYMFNEFGNPVEAKFIEGIGALEKKLENTVDIAQRDTILFSIAQIMALNTMDIERGMERAKQITDRKLRESVMFQLVLSDKNATQKITHDRLAKLYQEYGGNNEEVGQVLKFYKIALDSRK